MTRCSPRSTVRSHLRGELHRCEVPCPVYAMPFQCQTDQLVCFAGRSFEFMGDVGKFYSLISERSHQLTMRLKLGQMFDHNGTYMDVSFATLLKGMRCIDHSLAVRNPGFSKLGF